MSTPEEIEQAQEAMLVKKYGALKKKKAPGIQVQSDVQLTSRR